MILNLLVLIQVVQKIAINKHLTKQVCINNNLPTPKWDFFNTSKENINYKYLLKKYNNSMVVKPCL